MENKRAEGTRNKFTKREREGGRERERAEIGD